MFRIDTIEKSCLNTTCADQGSCAEFIRVEVITGMLSRANSNPRSAPGIKGILGESLKRKEEALVAKIATGCFVEPGDNYADS